MLKIKDPVLKNQIIQRLSRVEGQLRGVQKMIDEDRDCKEIVQQLLAIRSAVQSASLTFIQDVASECLLDLEQGGNLDDQRQKMNDLIQLMGKLSS